MLFETAAHSDNWYKLDNAGKIFPGQNTTKWSNVFRASVTLTHVVDKPLLAQAVRSTLVRFPYFNVRIRHGIFWYYFEKQEGVVPPVFDDIGNPCYRVKFKENNRFLFRVFNYNNKLSVEFFHALTDAYGALVFLMTLTAEYLRLRGEEIPCGGMVFDVNEPSDPGEAEDAFCRYATSEAHYKRSSDFVYHARGTKLSHHMVNVTTGYVDCEKFRLKAKEYGATVTEFASAILLDVLYRKQLREQKHQKKVSVQIPVNLRRHFETKTVRNFSLCYNVKIDPAMGEYTFDEIVHHTMLYLRLVNNPKELNAMMTKNMGLEKRLIMRLLPLFLKRAAIYLSFALTGEKTVSGLFSNVGVVTLPPEMQRHVESVMLMTGPGVLNGARLAAVTYNNTLAISFANIYECSDIERDFFTSIVKMGIHVKIESNRELRESQITER